MSIYSDEKINKRRTNCVRRREYCIGAYVDIHVWQKGKLFRSTTWDTWRMARSSIRLPSTALGRHLTTMRSPRCPISITSSTCPGSPDRLDAADNTFRGKPYPLNTRVALKSRVGAGGGNGLGLPRNVLSAGIQGRSWAPRAIG